MKQIFLSILFFVFLTNCMLTEAIGIPTYGAVKGSEAKKRISDAIFEAESTASSFWLAQSGMKGGQGPISPLLLINGFLAKFIYSYLAEIDDEEFFMEESVLQCETDIRTKGALVLGATYDSLTNVGGVTRDALLLPEFASCDLENTGKIITLEPIRF
ncbi:TIGR04452 family lipoprotein [Leptospira sp. 2 VSF19]|uniref:TIGR04452 family lipoprotein n=1 Tax=Leptospira soteropolitanensis TaxID=2950025 RepID=A0AAW5VFI4_9LEPT|nr:TIGR04452 family lipoprotein [Leptospira soteropolitanensis]MCW7491389.1 TIGR04452 family lipoprotein [Leptospira soteropolitanensis]MCW7498974.1 TIGR04452 family lipoprotein [Leptospira soteropolitanensis]MCW7521434.1 TIGR04452 family lipoprotein [Leptospira soteropolitanensis]MCW7525077.1 TIGR04452 family lipoprotein [Leptospira soteropolitanensis]MCW7528945.1 TIGR04452 family lipoprotein [Leptospira soteropolitanensis]